MVINMRLCQPSTIMKVVTFSLHQKLRVINVHTYLGILRVHILRSHSHRWVELELGNVFSIKLVSLSLS